jgi:murein DD-endopeptidase MepM/ murein hydrolase activator NlpD
LIALSLVLLLVGTSVAPSFAQRSAFSQGTLRNAYLLLRLQDYLNRANESYSSLQQKIDDTRTDIEENRHEISTLRGQLQHLDILIEESTHKIRNVEEQIQEKEMDITKTLEAIEFNEIERLNQGEILADYLRLLYFEKNQYFGRNNQVNSLKLFLQDNTLSGVLQNGTYIRLLEKQAEISMESLEDLEYDIRLANVNLVTKRHQLGVLRAQLDGEHRNVEAEYQGKKNLLDHTLNSDEIYRELFASYRLAQEVILDEINLFHTNIDVLDERISMIAPQLSPFDVEQIEAIQTEASTNFSTRVAANFLDLTWPVAPNLGLSAFFDDSGYVATFGAAHHALDIPIAHNSIFYAPADGVIYKVKDTAALEDPINRLGYGYMIVAHRKGVMTLYGHMGTSLVREGDFVRKGQILGLTGGTPGTPGAGIRTTGAHLHFEVFQDGVRVDPLDYLPLDRVPEHEWVNIPEHYLEEMQQRLSENLENDGFDEEALEAFESSDEFNEITPLDLEVQETLDNSLPDDQLLELLEEDDHDHADEEDYWERGEE